MPWFKVDDSMHSHPKARRAGIAAMGLWVLCGSYMASHLTEGFVDAAYVKSCGPNGTRLAQRLVAAGLWYPDERDGVKGWSMHDWDHYQQSKAHVERERKQARIRQQSRRDSRRESRGVSQDPVPSRPVPSFTSSYLGEGKSGREPPTDEPPPLCPKHGENYDHDEPCRACRRVREFSEKLLASMPTPSPPQFVREKPTPVQEWLANND